MLAVLVAVHLQANIPGSLAGMFAEALAHPGMSANERAEADKDNLGLNSRVAEGRGHRGTPAFV